MQALGSFFEGGGGGEYLSKCHTMHTIKWYKYKFKGLEIILASLVQHEQRPIFQNYFYHITYRYTTDADPCIFFHGEFSQNRFLKSPHFFYIKCSDNKQCLKSKGAIKEWASSADRLLTCACGRNLENGEISRQFAE